MDGDKSLVAIFNRISAPGTNIHMLTTTAIPEHGGTITRSPNETHYAAGTQVTVTATATPGYRFTGWGGALTSTAPGVVVSMDGPRALIANFEPITHLLTINRSPTAGGTVTPPSGQRHYDNTPVTITATPANGYRFINWTVTDGGIIASANSATTTVTLRADAAATANFQQEFTLTINRNTETGGSVTPQSGLNHDANTPVSITAAPASGYTFVNWTVTSGTATFGNSTGPNTTVTLSSNATIRANFEQIFTLTVDRYPTVGGTVTPASQSNIAARTPFNISAAPAIGYRFVNWTVTSGTATIGNANNANTTVTLSSNAAIRANFQQIFTLTLEQNPTVGGTVTPASGLSHDANTPVTITATPASGYTFVNWTVTSGTATIGSATNSNTTVTLSSNTTIRANFARELGWQFNPNITYGTFTDSRDSRSYRTVTIGGQTWMAENLNFNASGSVCYGNDPGNCDTYGRLYDWNTAMTACPAGWRVPSDAEWTTLTDFVGGVSIAGTRLKSTSGWQWYGGGTDDFGFSALPGGNGWSGSFFNVGGLGYWWSATESNASDAWNRNMYLSFGRVDSVWTNKANQFSVRCVRD
jgi:uncharacterized protein (TIGR02145 family)